MHSLSRRLLASVSVPLVLFFGVTMVVLDTGFRTLSDQALQEALESEMVSLIAAAEPQAGGGYAPAPHTLDPRLATPRSGLYAQIRSGSHSWRSPSTAGVGVEFGPALLDGEHGLSYGQFGRDRVAVESRTIRFDNPGGARTVTFSVALSLAPYRAQLQRFRQELGGWFAALTALLLVTLAILLRWVLAPLRRMEREIGAVEEGRSERLGAGYPRELAGVARNLNVLLHGERTRVARYRDTLGNLAHSLKTPLAVMRAALDGPRAGPIAPELDRISDIIEHQLRRAAASSGPLLGQAPVEVAPVAAELRATLLKVYAGKDLVIEVQASPGVHFSGDRGDLTELLGNVLDNACKWCHGRVRLRAVLADPEVGAAERERLEITVEDDGPGISARDRERVLGRGVRADESVPGHGLGLAMVRDTVELYGGRVAVETSALGGARIVLRLPGR